MGIKKLFKMCKCMHVFRFKGNMYKLGFLKKIRAL